MAWADLKVKLTKHDIGVGTIAKLNVLELDLTLLGPFFFDLLFTYKFLLRSLLEVEYALNLDHHSHEMIQASEDVH